MTSSFSGKSGRQAGMFAADTLERSKYEGYGFLDNAFGDAKPLYAQAGARFSPYSDAGLSGLGLYTDSLGVNGAAGNQRAVSAFQTGPGYQFAQDAARQAGLRSASASGMLASGNTLAALSDRAQQIGNQEYGNWQTRLSGLGSMGLQAAGAQGGLDTGLADLGVNIAQNKATIGANAAQGIASAGSGALMAGQQAAANRLNLGMSIFSGLSSLATGAFGGQFGAGMFSPTGAFGGK